MKKKTAESRYGTLTRHRRKYNKKNGLTVVSYNIRLSKKMASAIKLMRNNDNLKNADIICLQEMNNSAAKTFAEELKYNYVYYPAAYHIARGRYLGNAIFSKYPIKDDFKIILPDKKSKLSRRIAVSATLDINGTLVSILSLHKEVFIKKGLRAQQIRTIFNALGTNIEKCVIAGDFNTFTKASLKTVTDVFREKRFISATSDVGWTFQHWYFLNKKSALDHIFVKGLKVRQSGKVNDHSASDHLPIWVQLDF